MGFVDDAAGGSGLLGQGAVGGALEDRDRVVATGGDVGAGAIGGGMVTDCVLSSALPVV